MCRLRSSFPGLLAVLVLSAGLAACGGDPATGDDVTDAGPDLFDPGPVGVDTLDVPDVPEVPVDACSCTTTDECCDGCRPKNEGGLCGTHKNCFADPTCHAGACVGGDQPQDPCPPKPCATDPVCNPETGACDYTAVVDGTPCEAEAGVPGSGACGPDGCVGFGACDQRDYGQALGFPCNFDAECASGKCRAYGDEWTTYCTAACGEGLPACPDDMACVGTGPGLPRECRPLTRLHVLPGDASFDAFHVCNRDEDCQGGLCLSLDGKKFCTKDCGQDDAASDALCGSCGRCRDNGDELQFKYKFYCTPRGTNEIGQPCGWSGDCLRLFCQDGYCSDQCFILSEDLTTCKEWQACIAGPIETSPDLQVCVDKESVGRGLGETCQGTWACTAGICADVEGTMRCTADCAEVACTEGVCVETSGGKQCLPEAEVGTTVPGGACAADYQCQEGLVCAWGACLKGCETAADCGEGGVCYTDYLYQAMYCSKACEQDADCGGLACVDGSCAATSHGGTWMFGLCRVDGDCETGLCRQGLCTETCTPGVPCEVSVVLEVEEYGLCSPCNPAYYGADCAPPGGFSLNECIQGIDGKYFCAPSCWQGPESCPVGTRCYNISGSLGVCAPLSGACGIQGGCASSGTCVQPRPAKSPCVENVECAGGRCIDGRCQEGSCSSDADCGCDLLACDAGKCLLKPELAVREAEPNDALAQAQVLGSATVRVAADLNPAGDGPDVDLYRVTLAAGQALDVTTGPFCDVRADTLVRLRDASGAVIEGWENDDIDAQGGNWFSILVGYVAPAAGEVVVEVTQSPLFGGGLERLPYVLDLAIYAPAVGDSCGNALPLTPGAVAGDLSKATPTYSLPCAGDAGFGRDLAYAVTVPAGQVLRARLDSAFDGQLLLASDCDGGAEACLAGADRLWDPGAEVLTWVNAGAEPRPLFLVVKNFYLNGPQTFSLDLELRPGTAPANDAAAGAIPVDPAQPVVGTTVAAANDFTACKETATAGADVFYRVTMPAGTFWSFEIQGDGGPQAGLVLTPDPADPLACLDVKAGFLAWQNGDAEQTLYLVVDTGETNGMFDFTIQTLTGVPGPCFGACDSATFESTCQDAQTLCECDGNAKAIRTRDCDAACKANGALGGTCHAYTTPGQEGNGCLCDWGCDAVQAQCAAGYYTNCTCAAADPCQWVAEGNCDEFCAYEFPADHFDDTADCTPPAT